MSTEDTPTQGRHIDFDALENDVLHTADEFDLIAMSDRSQAYGPAWRERFATRHHLQNSRAS